MDYTLMIIASRSGGGMSAGRGATSQLKSFPTKTLADYVAKQVEDDAEKSGYHIEVIKLYLKEGT